MKNLYIKTNRVFSPIRKYGWLLTFVIGIGGLWYPKLGVLGLPLMLALTIMAFFKGRYWCGNFCPHGSYFDSFLNGIAQNRKIPKVFKLKITLIIFSSWFGFRITKRFIRVMSLLGTATFFDKLGLIFVSAYLMVLIAGGILSLFINQRTWCGICPMGLMQKFSYKLSKIIGIAKKTDKKVSIKSKDMCHICGKCARVCPMQLEPYTEFNDNNQFDNETCIRCSTCVINCPAHILSLDKETNAIKRKEETNIDGYENRQKIRAEIIKIKDLTADTKEYTFKFINPSVVKYKAGQFAILKIQDFPVMYRAYSISSYDSTGRTLKMTIKKVNNGYGTSIIFDTFYTGKEVELEAPLGNELVVDHLGEKIMFIAGGIGITPFVPMVQEMMEENRTTKEFKLVYGVTKKDDFMYDEFFSDVTDKCYRFEYEKIVANDETWNGKKGFVTDIISDMDLKDYKIYMCGPQPMVEATTKLLEQKMVPKENIFYESA